jgi:hypothetical protein
MDGDLGRQGPALIAVLEPADEILNYPSSELAMTLRAAVKQGGSTPTSCSSRSKNDLSRTWLLKEVGGAFQIQNAKTHKCLTIAGGTSPQNNLEAVQFDCDSDVSRIWRLDRAN